MSGIEHGVDRDATRGLLSSSGFHPTDKGLLRNIIAGAMWTRERAHKAGQAAASTCEFCSSGDVENVRHVVWNCAAWQAVRELHPEAMAAYKDDWPTCLSCCGIVPEKFDAVPAVIIGDGEETSLPGPTLIDLTQPPEAASLLRQETFHNGKVVIWTDGASRDNQRKATRRAGLGCFWATGHPHNISSKLEGDAQTNQRAELAAVLRVLLVERRPLEIRTDSKYVYDGCVKLAKQWRDNCWRTRSGKEVSNRDLWFEILSELSSRPRDSVSFRKVRGHATPQDVEAGRATLLDKAGNDAADALAVAGAASHGLSDEQRRQACAATVVGAAVQRLMVDVWKARGKAARHGQGSSPSDSGDASSSDSSSHSEGSSNSSIFEESSSEPSETDSDVDLVESDIEHVDADDALEDVRVDRQPVVWSHHVPYTPPGTPPDTPPFSFLSRGRILSFVGFTGRQRLTRVRWLEA